MIELGSLAYFIYFTIQVLLLVGLIVFLKNKTKKFQKWFIFGILVSGFILHFCKLFIKEYADNLPYSLTKVTFENICAVSTLIFPFIYISKSNKWKDYMYVLGILGGLGAMIFPNPALHKSGLSLEVMRFYYCHFVLLSSSVLMVYTGQHKLDYKRLWRVPLTFFEILCLIIVNELVLLSTGLVNGTMETLLGADKRNSSFIFGPTNGFEKFEGILYFVPKFLKTVPFGINKGKTLYWPILWLVLPAYFWISIISFFLYLPFNHNQLKEIFKKKERNN